MITEYDCRKAFIPVESFEYLAELEIGEESLESSQILFEAKKYSDAYIILYKALQNFGNAVLINKFKLRSKQKNCQFQYLYQENILTDEDIYLISNLSQNRNTIYYNNSGLDIISEDEYKKKYEKIMMIIKKLKEVIE